MTEKNREETGQPARYTKEQLVRSVRMADRRDLADALLKNGETYTWREADELIEKFRKGRVTEWH